MYVFSSVIGAMGIITLFVLRFRSDRRAPNFGAYRENVEFEENSEATPTTLSGLNHFHDESRKVLLLLNKRLPGAW